ncbi:BREX-3 system phosphatase PglZ [Methanomethylovorans sp.]|uniref:BREX-3 system phosphatase PglZ n=1 Tax=Methanomethylovorans sp. TaxID=2758717 RepID=UPI00345E3B53
MNSVDNWRDTILKEFVPGISKLTIVADPDDLLTEEKLSFELKNRGFDIIEFNDPIEFRYAYESKYRAIWDKGGNTELSVILLFHGTDFNVIPYDLLMAGRQLIFNLGKLFPNLSYPVIEKLDKSLLDVLFKAQKASIPGRMGDNATKDFILRHVFRIESELIKTDTDLLRLLLRLHYGTIKMPTQLCDRIVQALREQGSFKDWPLDTIVPEAEAFFSFLQERWPIFVKSVVGIDKVCEVCLDYSFNYPGPQYLPFDHYDIRIYIDNMFTEGKLTPIKISEINIEQNSWLRTGIIRDDNSVRINRLFNMIEEKVPKSDAKYSAWLSFAMKWAELESLVYQNSKENDVNRLKQTRINLNQVFANWLNEHYTSLINLPPINPVMLHHIPRMMARKIEEKPNIKVALIVVDGLALDQWVTIKNAIKEQSHDLKIKESAIFAWIPTITTVSRQAIFAGKSPLYFPHSIDTTNNEGNLWHQFWESIGISKLDICYQKRLGDGDFVTALEETTFNPNKTKVIGLVVDKVDKIMHGMQLGTAGMHSQIKQWFTKGFLISLINYLLKHEYQVWLTSDHGNIECEGKGKPAEGVIAETRGERVRIYPTSELRSSVARLFTFAREWQTNGLPSGYFPLVAEGSDAFIKEGEVIVGHGGISMEEVIVPLVKFERKGQ